ncbi:type IX secretion system motor protein PorM/GldM [Daejeonella oryzae]|uniref:type IX secretion system motor protein PorM/GldM n=1 Tax=Daejeonella oryzae TaxID=1122943 RepID=UPI0004093B1C|nr:gliding motility protein GldM [Daejeonella oryzae]
MAGGKESTRQKMINIMYLVLLAMLALNVSDTILNAFKNINDSLATSQTNVNNSVNQLFTSFENTKLKEEPERAKPIYEKAKQARAISAELNGYLEKLKQTFIKEGNGYDPETGDLVERSNLDIATGIMINKKEGARLKAKINETREKLINLIEPKDRSSLTFSLEAKDPAKPMGGKRTWEDVNFGEGTPLTAAMTILTKIQADTKNAESDVVKKIFGKMDQAVVNLDQFAAVAVAPTSYVIAGQPYTAEVFLTAYDSKSNPTITVGGSSLQVRDGKGVYSVNTGSEGVFSWVGTVRVKQTDGSIKEYKTSEQKYQVSRPSAVVSPDKMNVFYIGVPNPVSVSAPGIPKENLRVSMSGGSISGSNGKYTVRVNSAGAAKVNVSAEINGKVQNIGTSDFRVKRIPDPKAKFAGKTGGAMSSVVIKSQNAVFAILENFDFDAKFNVTRFNLVIAKPRADAVILQTSGNTLSSQMRAAMASVTPGTRVIFDNIVAVGPDGTQRQLDGIVLTAN